jgi:cytidylate kinase
MTPCVGGVRFMMACVDGERETGTRGPSAAIGGGEETFVITIDGPAASGKSSVSRLVAQQLGVPYVSSGLLYRAATYLAQASGEALDDEAALLQLLSRHRVQLVTAVGVRNRVSVDGHTLDHELHTDRVDAGVSAVARHPGVRAWVDARLRELTGAFVVEGRDMGTQVFPRAAAKFYLNAPPEVRAARRVGERTGDLEAVTASLRRRDQLDAAQSCPAPDAVYLDTRDLTLDEVVARVLGALSALRRGL